MPECVVVDAVRIEPPKFPDIRESAGNFLQFAGNSPWTRIKTRTRSGDYKEIPYTTKQGIFLQRAAKLATRAHEQGNNVGATGVVSPSREAQGDTRSQAAGALLYRRGSLGLPSDASSIDACGA